MQHIIPSSFIQTLDSKQSLKSLFTDVSLNDLTHWLEETKTLTLSAPTITDLQRESLDNLHDHLLHLANAAHTLLKH